MLGMTAHPDGARVTQQTRNLLVNLDHGANTVRFLLRDRDTKFTSNSIHVLKIPPRAPRANAFAERWVRTTRTECTDRLLISGQRHLRTVLNEIKRRHILGGLINEYQRTGQPTRYRHKCAGQRLGPGF
ncbi:hypothetical protein ABZ815_46025 [Nonomuraea sp. NPDC047529]|uniref:hypothetical protein n=1 Tax=Nonomuraea sp. NPDC047529 TaxID=3155623 RepID=UPI0033EFFF0C